MHDKYSKELAEKYGYHDWMIARFLTFVPDTKSLLEYVENYSKNKRDKFEYIRANNLKIKPEVLERTLINKGYIVEKTRLKEVFKLRRTKDGCNSKTNTLPSIGSTIEYLKGYYYIQDLSSCLAVEELEINENNNSTILDMAAAPGGKTTFMAQKMNNNGNIIACEPNIKRIPSLIFNISRCNVKNTTIFNINGENIDELGLKFDRILLDAPCSCEGIIAKDHTRKKSREFRDIEICSIKQKKLIKSAIKVLKSGGIMIYCTCSFAPEENEIIIDDVLKSDLGSEIKLEPIEYGNEGLSEFNDRKFSKVIKNTKRLYPHIHDTNGFFIAKLKRK